MIREIKTDREERAARVPTRRTIVMTLSAVCVVITPPAAAYL